MPKQLNKNTFLQILNDIEARKSMGDIMAHNDVGYETIRRCKRALKCINADNVDGVNELYYTNSITSPMAQYAKDEIYKRRDEAKQLQKQKESQKQTECEKPENKPKENEMLYTLMNIEALLEKLVKLWEK